LADAKAQARPAWWVRVLAALPWWFMNPLADLLAWLSWRVVRVEQRALRANLTASFPDLTEPQLQQFMRDYYRGFGQVLVEVVRSVSLSAQELRQRVVLEGFEPVRAALAAGTPVLLVAAHQCNWEWLLLALSLELGYPLDAAYKPLVDNWAERAMKKLRTRFGSRLVPATDLLADIIRRRDVVRAVAMVADQEPTMSEHKYWTSFLNRDTAFYMGTEEIARVTRFPVFFLSLRRIARGYYEGEFHLLAAGGETLPSGALTERYARQVEAQIRAAPADWPWSHKRWKLKRSLYQNR
jgi:KDO2-lipid IV(A) lauroyltransferase